MALLDPPQAPYIKLRRSLPVVFGGRARQPLGQRHEKEPPERIQVGLVHLPKVVELVIDTLALRKHVASRRERLAKVTQLRRRQSVAIDSPRGLLNHAAHPPDPLPTHAIGATPHPRPSLS